jgi:hypothetical protein
MTKLVFHLGDRKSGSTAIQTALAARNWTCDSVRLLYPHGNKINHNSFARSLTGSYSKTLTAPLIEEILDEIRADPPDVVIISAEDFEDVDPTVLRATIEAYMPEMLADARFIAYVRPHAERFPSSFAERVKAGHFYGTLTGLHSMLHKRKAFVYAPRFLNWREVFGAAFTLRPLIRDLLYRNDVVADFLQFALQTDDFTLTTTPDANESLSLENLAILRQLHLRLSEGKTKVADHQSTIGRALARRMNESAFRDGTKVRIHKALAEEVRQQYAEDAAAVDAAFFTGTPLTDALNAAPQKAVDQEQSVLIEDHFSAREQYLINTFIDQTAVLINAYPRALAEKLRFEHKTKVVTEDSTEGESGQHAVGKGKNGRKVGSAKRKPGADKAERAKGPGPETDEV